jgi:hypothetical protein
MRHPKFVVAIHKHLHPPILGKAVPPTTASYLEVYYFLAFDVPLAVGLAYAIYHEWTK